ncbi:HAD family hydrolase [Polymorphum gilvum]|uniref:Hydrolase, haloacid dehalogenase-like family n=1 Tax=Polymorphum gilvum (strain LMG 25793 / CGMCC 1.9160 / SL003B-26A1) TaxID=991905 RepID=F2IUY6_POLGS|nr:HAD family hydrolase [Polymorphum gilvum]ADZ70215.1 Hydrolase, haloacid dehalogenase-like family [Polymorphum gilvum SL003B-26A1]
MSAGGRGLDTVLFDLDGTLTDPFPGITRSIQHALEALGAPVPAAEALRWCIGPPLAESFAVLLGTDDTATLDRAIALYRERYAVTGLFENTLIEGIEPLLRMLADEGRRLFVATSKPYAYAGRIVEHFGLAAAFAKVYGSELDGRRAAKTDLIAYLLAEEGLTAQRCVMVGDRKHDLIGARANRVAAVGVTWGYGSREELAAEAPDAIVDAPRDLAAWLDQGEAAPAPAARGTRP